VTRPHFAYRTPKGYSDEPALYPFDYRNMAIGPDTNVTQPLYNLILRLDADAPFHWRGIHWTDGNGQWLAGPIALRIRDAYGNYLSSDFVPVLNLAQGYYIVQPWTGATPPYGPVILYTSPIYGGMGVPFANELICPPSSILQIDVAALDGTIPGVITGASAIPGRFFARGVKRRPVGDCATEAR
jgi:hypothetical protein